MAGPPDLAEVKDYLTAAGSSATDPEITDALAAELAAQARIVKASAIPAAGEWPADVTTALKRRVLRHLAMKALSLGYQTTATDLGVISTRIGRDPEIVRLEAPYRRLPIG